MKMGKCFKEIDNDIYSKRSNSWISISCQDVGPYVHIWPPKQIKPSGCYSQDIYVGLVRIWCVEVW